jgi:hypothetical protein
MLGADDILHAHPPPRLKASRQPVQVRQGDRCVPGQVDLRGSLCLPLGLPFPLVTVLVSA